MRPKPLIPTRTVMSFLPFGSAALPFGRTVALLDLLDRRASPWAALLRAALPWAAVPWVPDRSVLYSIRLCQQTRQRLRQFGRAVDQGVLPRQGHVVDRAVRRSEAHTPDAVTEHHVHGDIVPGQGGDV